MSERDSPGRPARLVARQISELLLARVRRWHVLVPQERINGVVFDVVLSAGIAHLAFCDPGSGEWVGVEQAARLGRPVNATAIAQSMGLPLTTVRRHAGALVDAGLLVRAAAGFAVAPAIFAGDGVAAIAAGDAADLMRVLGVLADTGYAPAAKALASDPSRLPAGLVERLLLVFAVRALESFTGLYGDVVTGTILVAMIAANVRHVTGDPVLARRYAEEDTPPPDSQRRPVALRVLARAIDLPFETVRRRVAAQVAAGNVVWRGDGAIVPTHVLLDERHRDNNRRIIGHFEQMLQTLASLAAVPIPTPDRHDPEMARSAGLTHFGGSLD